MQKITLQNARWIYPGGWCHTPLIRRTVTLPKIGSAKITVAALGIFELYINGQRVGEDYFTSLYTDYCPRPQLKMKADYYHGNRYHRLYCPQYDITPLLHEGANSVCFLMAPGWLHLPVRARVRVPMSAQYGDIGLCYSLEYTDACGNRGQIVSDGGERWRTGFVTEYHLQQGETQDFRDYEDEWLTPGFCDAHWAPVVPRAVPETNLYLQDSPTDRVIRHVTPKPVSQKGNKTIYDVGEIITGYPVLKSTKDILSTVTVRYGELLTPEGELHPEHIYNQHTVFYDDGINRPLHSRFTWHCFRYFEVEGAADVVDCVVIHADVAVTSDFNSSSDTLNWLKDAYIRTQLLNMHTGVPSDCPHAERLGYTGDGQLTCAAAMLQLDAQRFYKKWIWDIADCQDAQTGYVHNTAPFTPNAGGGPGGWGCAIVAVPYYYYKNYGDTELLRQMYPKMLLYFNSLESLSDDDLVTRAYPGMWCLGDWCVPTMGEVNDMEGIKIPAPLVNTYYYVKSMEMAIEVGRVLGETSFEAHLQDRIARKKAALTEKYFDPATGDFAENQQGSNAFALDLGLGDDRTWQNTQEHYAAYGQFDTGIFGTDVLIRLLFQRGRADLAVALLTNEKENSFFRHKKSGLTTIPEYWTGHRSQCHPMFGAVSRYLYEYILGIRQTDDSAAYQKVEIAPLCMAQIPEASGHVTTPRGKIAVAYNQKGITVEIPPKTEAVLKLGGQEYPLASGTNPFSL